MCQPPFYNGEKKQKKRPKCDGGHTCLCHRQQCHLQEFENCGGMSGVEKDL
jgi:hypothetical protein